MAEPTSTDGRNPPDLPLHSIPSVPRPRMTPGPSRGLGPYVLGGAALFGFIVAISFLAAPYVKLPDRTTKPDSGAELQAASAPIPGPSGQNQATSTAAEFQAAELQTAQLQPPQPTGASDSAEKLRATTEPQPAARPSAEEQALRRDLQAKESALLQAQTAVETERKARREAERRLEQLTQEAKSSRAAGDKKLQSRVAELDQQLAELKAASAASATAHATEVSQLTQRLEAAEAARSKASSALQKTSNAHENALAAESDAVRQMLAQLNDARRDLATEREQRKSAEDRLRQLEQSRSQPTRTTAASPDPTATASSGATVQPERVKTIPPSYPEDLRRARIAGRVLLRLLVDPWGNVEQIEIADSPHPRLADAAERAAKDWKYSPARQDGQRISMWVTEAIDFKI